MRTKLRFGPSPRVSRRQKAQGGTLGRQLDDSILVVDLARLGHYDPHAVAHLLAKGAKCRRK